MLNVIRITKSLLKHQKQTVYFVQQRLVIRHKNLGWTKRYNSLIKWFCFSLSQKARSCLASGKLYSSMRRLKQQNNSHTTRIESATHKTIKHKSAVNGSDRCQKRKQFTDSAGKSYRRRLELKPKRVEILFQKRRIAASVAFDCTHPTEQVTMTISTTSKAPQFPEMTRMILLIS